MEKDVQVKILDAIKSEKVLTKHILSYTWISGSSTEVCPITMWPNEVDIQVDSNRNYFDACINRILKRFPSLFSNGYFCKYDGSCPNVVRFVYTEAIKNIHR